MGSNMKPTIFNDRVANALRSWHQGAKKQLKQNRGSITPFSSRPGTPSRGMSPIHLLQHYKSELDSVQTTPRTSNFRNEGLETDGPDSPSHQNEECGDIEMKVQHADQTQHEIDICSVDFSFEKRTKA